MIFWRGGFEIRPSGEKTLLVGKKSQDREAILPPPSVCECPEYQWINWKAELPLRIGSRFAFQNLARI